MADTTVYLADGSDVAGVAAVVEKALGGTRVTYGIDDTADEEPGYSIAVDLNIRAGNEADERELTDSAVKVRDALASELGLSARTEDELEADSFRQGQALSDLQTERGEL